MDTLVKSAQDRFLALRNNLGESTDNMKKKVNDKQTKREIVVGDRVYVKINVRNQLNYKLGPKFQGPFQVIEGLIGNKYKVKCLESEIEKVVHLSQLKLVFPRRKKQVRFSL